MMMTSGARPLIGGPCLPVPPLRVSPGLDGPLHSVYNAVFVTKKWEKPSAFCCCLLNVYKLLVHVYLTKQYDTIFTCDRLDAPIVSVLQLADPISVPPCCIPFLDFGRTVSNCTGGWPVVQLMWPTAQQLSAKLIKYRRRLAAHCSTETLCDRTYTVRQ